MYSPQTPENTAFELGHRYYELSNHLGNVLTVISDVKTPVSSGGNVASYTANIVNISDYSPFGVQLDGRTVTSDQYRYGFQGQEKDDEVKGEGNSVNYKYRMHDPRVGRFFAVDPLAPKYPWYTPYQFSGNKLIDHVELEGLEERDYNVRYEGNSNEPSRFFKDKEGMYQEWQAGDEYVGPDGTNWEYLGDFVSTNESSQGDFYDRWEVTKNLDLDPIIVSGNETGKGDIFSNNCLTGPEVSITSTVGSETKIKRDVGEFLQTTGFYVSSAGYVLVMVPTPLTEGVGGVLIKFGDGAEMAGTALLIWDDYENEDYSSMVEEVISYGVPLKISKTINKSVSANKIYKEQGDALQLMTKLETRLIQEWISQNRNSENSGNQTLDNLNNSNAEEMFRMIYNMVNE